MSNSTNNIVKQYVKDRAVLDSEDHIVVHAIWEGRYRVNVWKYNPNRISQSYFISVHDDGNITCNPSLSA